MSATAHQLSAATIAQTDSNLRLLREFTRRFTANPELLAQIPDGATLVLLPDDDDNTREMNIEMGLAAVRAGRNVYFMHMQPPGDGG